MCATLKVLQSNVKREQRSRKTAKSALGQNVEEWEVVHRGGGKEAWEKVGGRESRGGDGRGGQEVAGGEWRAWERSRGLADWRGLWGWGPEGDPGPP